MGDDEYDKPEEALGPTGRSPDPAVHAAQEALLVFFKEHAREVYYEQQLLVLFERSFFHWVTSRALKELREGGRVKSETMVIEIGEEGADAGYHMRFYRANGHRFWKRQRDEIYGLVREFSKLTHPLGSHAETMFDAALAGECFCRRARDVREYGEKKWIRTGEDLDRVYERDGILYGSEIKNTLKYIRLPELDSKLEICATLGLRPLFIARMLPKNYIYKIINSGGYALVFGDQLYPFGHDALMNRVRATLGLPVLCPRTVPDGLIKRFSAWHEKSLLKGA